MGCGVWGSQPYQHASLYARAYQDVACHEPRDVDDALQTVTLGELREWAAGLWRRGYGQALVQGNLLRREAEELVADVAQVRSGRKCFA